MANITTWLIIGFTLIVIGMLVIFSGTIYSSIQQNITQKFEVGGIIMIGPIPIIFGNSWKAINIAIILAIVLMILAIALIIINRTFLPKIPS
ncbi:putative membrane protein [Caldisphaera lagunensis DSM 15908]|uniref:Putative membrane protein n=1 Tax=Caldisphaera lagunensis (strain DSM 15908 / JCM 11604 / ANMR 0165 / IC-154) TaxID=1056495 RepID=L0A9T6_CALLD|nr:DUF131 domain-containing protein [Caldisphaera lagunensis]AFZ69820.1 putative membrane protein [Caldisphaera lagunensis DSM 15908]